VKNLETFSTKHLEIESVNGTHLLSALTNDDVKGIIFDRKKSSHPSFFPLNIEYFFKNLNLIRFVNMHLKEIHSCDLKPFPKLKFLSLFGNDLQVIGKDLFQYNQQLEALWVAFNKMIRHIDTNVFDNLQELKFLDVRNYYDNTCDLGLWYTNITESKDAIKKVQSKMCYDEVIGRNYEESSSAYCQERDPLRKINFQILKVKEHFEKVKNNLMSNNMDLIINDILEFRLKKDKEIQELKDEIKNLKLQHATELNCP
jgi:hypothetical protein